MDAPIPLEQLVAREVVRLALLELRMQESPGPADFELALRMLELARDFVPDDVELARKIVAAAWGTGDEKAVEAATRELLRLDPSDTVAQLRIISARIGRAQTAEERLSLYDRFLGPQGTRLDASVRSRLALDAALLAREQGEEEKFVDLLKRAMSLDATNKAAAQLALTFFEERVEDQVGRFEMILHLLYADPLDPNVHLMIAQVLADNGEMKAAERFHNAAATLFSRSGNLPDSIEMNSLALRWQIYGAQSTFDVLSKTLATMRENAQLNYDAKVAAGEDPETLVKPEEVRLDLEKQKVLILAAMGIKDEEQVKAAMDDLKASIFYATEQLLDPDRRPEGWTEERAASQALSMNVELQVYRLWTGVEGDLAVEETAQLHEQAGNLASMLKPIDPWVLYHDGKYEQAIAAVDEMGAAGGRLAFIVRALCLEKLGRIEEASEVLYSLARSNGLAPSSAWARGHASELDGGKGLRTEQADALAELANEVPRFIDDMLSDTSSFMSLKVSTRKRFIEVNEPWRVSVRLRNLAPIPLAVGSDRPINSRILLQPHKDNNAGFFQGQLYPEVVELNTRLRLEPRETIEETVSVDLGPTGLVISLNSLSNHRLRWRALQGFVIGSKGSYRAGPMCQSAESGTVDLHMNRLKKLPSEEIGVSLRSSTPEQLGALLTLVRSVFLAWPLRDTQRPIKIDDTISEALADRFQSATNLERALMLSMLPASRLELNLARFDEVALALPKGSGFRVQSHAELVEALVLVTRVTDPGSDLFEHAEQGASPRVASIARLVRERLREGRPCFARAETLDDWFPRGLQR